MIQMTSHLSENEDSSYCFSSHQTLLLIFLTLKVTPKFIFDVSNDKAYLLIQSSQFLAKFEVDVIMSFRNAKGLIWVTGIDLIQNESSIVVIAAKEP